ncbi:MAG TPA: amino acid ABC transporter substrate-binding protein [Casimicrobiaceae bacterium]|nr:amino acid ABC transporter substrate-binding protein [Casimicrobiaceae bacterium]
MRFSPFHALVALSLACAAAPAALAGPVLDRVKATGTIVMGYRDGAAPFSFKDRGGRVRGYSVELCEQAAIEIGKAAGVATPKIDWRPLSAAQRLDAVARGEVDIECGMTTISLARMANVDFSVPIYVDGGAILVRDTSKFSRLSDLREKRIAVIPGTTTEQALTRTLSAIAAPAIVVPVGSYGEGVLLLESGKVDGVAGDRIALTAMRAQAAGGAGTDFLPSDISYEPYGLVVRRDDPDFRLAVNRAVVELYRSGGIDPIFQRWFGLLGRPGPMLHAMFYLNTLPP